MSARSESRSFIRPLDAGFLLGGIALTVLGGTALGAVHLLYVYGIHRPSPLTHVQAHAHAQLFGFFGLFLFAFGLQLLPRFVRRPLPFPRLARASLWLLVFGATLHWLGQPATRWGFGFALLAVAGPLVAAGAVAFAANVLGVTAGFDAREGFQRLVRFGAVGFAAAAVGAAVLSVRAAVLQGALYPPAIQAVWALALFAGVVPFTLGVAGRMVPPMVGGGVVRAGALRAAHVLLLAFAPVEALSALVPAHLPIAQGLGAAGRGGVGLGLCAGAAAFLFPKVKPMGLWADPFFALGIGAALVSLAVGGVLRALGTVAEASGLLVDALFHDAVRHIITVGFLFVLTVTMAQKLVPALRGTQLRLSGLRWWVLGLLVASVPARAAQALAPHGWPGALRVSAYSGTLAWAALVLFGAMIAATVRASAPSTIPGGA